MPIGNGSLSSLAQIVKWPTKKSSSQTSCISLPSEGKGRVFESRRARHDFNDLARYVTGRCWIAEAPRKQQAGDIWTDWRRLCDGQASPRPRFEHD